MTRSSKNTMDESSDFQAKLSEEFAKVRSEMNSEWNERFNQIHSKIDSEIATVKSNVEAKFVDLLKAINDLHAREKSEQAPEIQPAPILPTPNSAMVKSPIKTAQNQFQAKLDANMARAKFESKFEELLKAINGNQATKEILNPSTDSSLEMVAANPIEGEMSGVNEMPDSLEIMSCESAIHHSIVEENVDKRGVRLPLIHLQPVLGSGGEGTAYGSANGSPKAWFEESTSGLKAVSNQNAIDHVARKVFDETSQSFRAVLMDEEVNDSYTNGFNFNNLAPFDPGGVSVKCLSKGAVRPLISKVHRAYIDGLREVLLLLRRPLSFIDAIGNGSTKVSPNTEFEEATTVNVNVVFGEKSLKSEARFMTLKDDHIPLKARFDLDWTGRSHSSKVQGLGIAHHILDGMPKLFCDEPNEECMLTFGFVQLTINLGCEATKVSSSITLSRSMSEGVSTLIAMENHELDVELSFGKMLMFVFDPGGSSLFPTRCNSFLLTDYEHHFKKNSGIKAGFVLPFAGNGKSILSSLLSMCLSRKWENYAAILFHSTFSLTVFGYTDFIRVYASTTQCWSIHYQPLMIYKQMLIQGSKFEGMLALVFCKLFKQGHFGRLHEDHPHNLRKHYKMETIQDGSRDTYMPRYEGCPYGSFQYHEEIILRSHKLVVLMEATISKNFVWDPGLCVIFVYILEDKDVFERVGKRLIPMDMTFLILERSNMDNLNGALSPGKESEELCNETIDETIENSVKLFFYIYDKQGNDQFMSKTKWMVIQFGMECCVTYSSTICRSMSKYMKLLCTRESPMGGIGYDCIQHLIDRSAGSIDIICRGWMDYVFAILFAPLALSWLLMRLISSGVKSRDTRHPSSRIVQRLQPGLLTCWKLLEGNQRQSYMNLALIIVGEFQRITLIITTEVHDFFVIPSTRKCIQWWAEVSPKSVGELKAIASKDFYAKGKSIDPWRHFLDDRVLPTIFENALWDPGVSHFTTLRTRRLLRGRICHDPSLLIRV